MLIGILASIAAQKMISAAEEAEITAENMTIDILRSNLLANYGNELLQGRPPRFPDNPFVNLSKVPSGYQPRRLTPPTGAKPDNNLWVYVPGSGSGDLTAEEAGTTLPTFRSRGFIYHQRKDGTIVKWGYDSSNGVISRKIFERLSEAKQAADRARRERGERTEMDRLR